MSKVYLQLINLKCYETEDWWGTDEPYLRINGKTVWNGKLTSKDDERDLIDIEPILIYETTMIELWDKDLGFFDEDDLIGKEYVHVSLAGKGKKQIRFEGGGAKYILTYKIISGSSDGEST